MAFCGHLLQKPVQRKSGGREHAAETRNSERVQREGRERAQLVRAGMFVGGECTNETEPYIVAIAVWANGVGGGARPVLDGQDNSR